MRPVISHAILRSFGRVRGRVLSESLRHVVQHSLPALLIDEGLKHPADAFLGAYQEIRLEIGFGSGEHLVHLAKLYPHIGFIGCEPYLNGVAAAALLIEQEHIPNIRIFHGDARVLLANFSAASLSQIFILFPDPWPKTKHHKKRLVSGNFPDELARVLVPSGMLTLATDHPDYATWMLSFMLRCPFFHWQARTQADWQTPPKDWTETRYQQKARKEGREGMFFVFERE